MILPIVESKLKFAHVGRKMLFADFMIAPDNLALQKRSKRFNRVRVDRSYYVFALSVIHGSVIVVLAEQPTTAVLIGRNDGLGYIWEVP